MKKTVNPLKLTKIAGRRSLRADHKAEGSSLSEPLFPSWGDYLQHLAQYRKEIRRKSREYLSIGK